MMPYRPLDTCFVLREGPDVTLVSWGAMLHDTLAAADALSEHGIGCEIIDVATLKPLDLDTILASVTKTGPPAVRLYLTPPGTNASSTRRPPRGAPPVGAPDNRLLRPIHLC